MELLIDLLCIILAYIYVKKKMPVAAIVCFVFVLLIGSPLLVYYRASVGNGLSKGDSLITTPITAFKKVVDSDVKTSFHILIDRLNDGQYTAGCI